MFLSQIVLPEKMLSDVKPADEREAAPIDKKKTARLKDRQ